MYSEHILSGGNLITLSSEGDHPTKPWQVVCYDSAADDAEVRWSKDFATRKEAEREYHRFD